MRKNIFFLLLGVISTCLSAFGQATSLTIDNQTPGWLSSKINYGDQQTVEDLTVTGYVNFEDLHFLGTLMQKQKLTKTLNLENVVIVGDSNNQDDDISFHNIFNLDYQGVTLDELALPTSIDVPTPKSNVAPLKYLRVNKLIYGSSKCNIYNNALWGYWIAGGSGANSAPKHLVLREGVDSIASYACDNSTHNLHGGGNVGIESIKLPQSLKYIGKSAFEECKMLQQLNLSDNIEIIEDLAFYHIGFNPDTLIVPKGIKIFNTRSFNIPKVIYLGENIERIYNTYSTYNNSYNTWTTHDYWDRYNSIMIYIHAVNPPTINRYAENFLSGSTIYVPKASLTLYKNAANWGKALSILPIPVNVSSISIKESELLNVGQDKTLVVSIFPLDADDKALIWESSNIDVATVSQDGTIKALSPGKSTIKVTSVSNPDIYAECIVTVTQPVNSITLNKSEVVINVGKSEQLEAVVIPSNATDKRLIWKSNNENVVTVSENGLLSAISVGEAVITVSAHEDETIKSQCKVTVSQPVTSISLSVSNILFKAIGETKELVASISPEDASNKNIKWTSSDDKVGMVSPRGVVTAVGEGSCVIIATSEDGGYTASCVAKVDLNAVETIILDKNQLTMHVNDSEQLTITNLPSNFDGKTITWSSSDESVAKVTSDGLVTAISIGSAKIIVMIGDVYAVCQVNVTPIIAEGITLDYTQLSIEIGQTKPLIATILPSNTTNKTVVWTSSDENIATVSDEGNVTAVSHGEAVITASTTDGSNLTATCNINSQSDVTSIYIPNKGISIKVIKGTIIVEGAEEKSIVYVFDLTGNIIYRGYGRSITLNNKGVYIVRIEETQKKVIL